MLTEGDYFGFEYNGTPYYYIKNLQGDVIAICNNAGNTVVPYEYDAWGRLMSYTDTTGINLVTKNPIRYRAYNLDHETGFYYLNSRYYSAEICRFLSPDVYVSTGQGILGYNMFAYCNNNPVNLSDNNGDRPIASTSLSNESSVERKLSCSYMSINNSTIFNHVDKTHITTPEFMLDLGPLFGKIGTSSTVYYEDVESAIFYTFSDLGNDMNYYGGGINIIDLIGVELGVNSNINGFVSIQLTPWLHGNLSIGLNSIGVIIGFDDDNISYDFEFYAGWGTIIGVAVSYVFSENYFPVQPKTASIKGWK